MIALKRKANTLENEIGGADMLQREARDFSSSLGTPSGVEIRVRYSVEIETRATPTTASQPR